jgi:hypothetical protein
MAGLDVSGLTLIPVVDESSGDNYYALCFDQMIDCVNWIKSDYERWPNGVPPSPWSHPLGSFFIRATLELDKIPKDLDVFTLKDWGGAFNFVVNETAWEKLSNIKEADKFLVFSDLTVE